MIQFNLLPDVKQEYIKAKRSRRNVSMIAIIITLVSGGIFLLMFLSANIFQPIHMNNLNEDIKTYTNELEAVPELEKVLTIQNQLNNIGGLHDSKPVTSRAFKYITQLTPMQVNITSIDLDLVNNTIKITGTADSLASVNKFIDTLKFTEFQSANGEQGKAFSDIVMESFSKNSKVVSYSISAKFNPIIFNGLSDVSLIVPNTTTTRSLTEKPSELFKINETEQ